MDLRLIAFVAAGGAIGAVARYLLQQWIPSESMPWGTMVAHLAGSFLLGAMFGAIAAGSEFSEESILLFGTGVLGAFTTMSTFAVDAIKIGESNPSNSIIMVLITLVGSVGLAWIGWRLTAAVIA